ncbi:ATP-binding protein [Streptomyces anandii]|uniref:ATP-binding protein n=1 Tax=Streptomyces anandii TaxID=285454 RepID=A0ABW6HAN8_9ACTN
MPHTELRFTVEGTAAAVRDARRRISSAVISWQVPVDRDLLFRLELVASEMLTNASQHAGGPLTVESRAERDSGLLVLTVVDAGRARPRPCVAGCDHESGRGIVLIDALSLFHGTEYTDSGKRCWAVLPLSGHAAPDGEEMPGNAEKDGRRDGDSARWTATEAGANLLRLLFPTFPAT